MVKFDIVWGIRGSFGPPLKGSGCPDIISDAYGGLVRDADPGW